MKEFFRTLPWRLKRWLSQITFYKKKAFAVTLTVIFSVLLVMTIAIRVFVRDTSSMMSSRGTAGFDMSDVDSSELEEMFGEMPDGMGDGADGSLDADSDGSSDDSTSGDGDTAGDTANDGNNASGNSDSGDMRGMPSGGMGDFSGDSDSMPSGDFSTEMGDFSGDVDGMPSGDVSGDSDSMPSGDFSGEMGDFSGNSDDASEESGDSDSSSDGTLTGDATTAATGAMGIMGFLQGWRAHWLIFLIIFAIADILCIVWLAILAHRKKKQMAEAAAQAREQMLAGEIVHTARPVKKHKVNSAAVWAIPMVGVLLLVAIVNAMSAQTSVSAAQTEATTYSGTAEVASMDTVLPGAGTLEEEDAVEIELLLDVEISKWYVSNGDTVEEGDTLALVDSVSVMSAIASLQEQLDTLDEELAECENEEISETITAAADGRVMAIYAEEDTTVTDTMYTYSALMLISLDGYLCVSMKSDADLSAGDGVVVTLSDDSTVDGKVGSVLSGMITILVADEDAALGESVSVTTKDGEEIGEGTLSIHSQLSVTGYAGTVSEIEAEVGDEVESGDTLLTLTDTEYTGTYEELLTQRSELEEAMQELFVLYQDPYLYATCDGVISGIDSSSDDSDSDDSDSDDSDDSDSDSSDLDDSSSDDSDSSDSEDLASVTVKENVISISTSSASGDTESTENTTSSEDASFGSSSTEDNTESMTSTDDSAADTSSAGSLDGENSSETDISSYTNLIGVVSSVSDGVATIIYLPDTYTISDYTDLGRIDLDTDLMTQTGTLTTSTGYLMFTYTGSSFSIGTAAELAAGDTIVLAYNSDGNLVWIVRVDVTEDDTDSDSTESGSDNNRNDSGSGSSSGSESSGSSSGSSSDSDSSGSNSGSSSDSGNDSNTSSGSGFEGSRDSESNSTDSAGVSSGSTGNSSDSSSDSDSIWGSISDYGSTDSSLDSSGSTYSDSADSSSADLSTLTSALSGSSDSSSADGTASDSSSLDGSTSDSSVSGDSSSGYSVSRTTAVSITPQDTMSLTITVDELDILSLEVGQTAQVTLDAFPGQSFEGEVTSIDLTGTNSGGSTKFTAVVTIDREEDMLVGMNASANIVIDTADEVLCIPEAALLEEDGTIYVYTTYDEETDTLGGLVEVTTGISDGENVEILSGLAEGDTYYYSYLDVVNYSTSSSSSGSSSFSIDSLFSSGGGGGGMSMP